MAISVIGVQGSMSYAEFSRLQLATTRASGLDACTYTGLDCTPGTGRSVNVSAGEAYQAGTLLTNDATVNVTIAANTSSQTRFDAICAEVDWFDDASGVATTKTSAGRIVVVQGTPSATPSVPALTKSPGVLWRTVIRHVRVLPGATSFTTAQLTDARVFPDTGLISLPSPTNWIDASAPLSIRRVGRVVELSGWITRTASAGVNVEIDMGALIPQAGWFRPSRFQTVELVSGLGIVGGSPGFHRMIVRTDGTASFYAVSRTLAEGDLLRVSPTHWLVDL